MARRECRFGQEMGLGGQSDDRHTHGRSHARHLIRELTSALPMALRTAGLGDPTIAAGHHFIWQTPWILLRR